MKNIDYTKYINYLLVGYAFAIPFSKAGANIFEVATLLLWILEGNWSSKFRLIIKDRVSMSILVLLSIFIISLPNASSLSFGLGYIAKFRHLLIVLVMLTSLKREFVAYIFSAFLSGMLISEITSYGIFFEWWHYNNVPPTDPSPFMSHTDYSVYLSFTSMILLLYIVKSSESLKRKLFYLFFLTTVTINLFINGGRTGQVVYLVSILILFIMSFKNRLKAVLLSAILLGSVFTAAYNFSPVFKNRFNYTISDITDMKNKHNYTRAFSKRVALWDIGYHQFIDKPIIGYGIGNDMKPLKEYIKKLGYSIEALNGYSDNHNTFITIALQLGILGLIASVIIFYYLIRLPFKSDFYKILNTIFVVSFIMWSLGGNTLHLMNSLIFFALFAGLFNKISYLEEDRKLAL